jgi:GNAT superfamily N-acetyltransferase
VARARAATAADLPILSEFWQAAVSELDGQRGGTLLAGSLVTPGPLDDALRAALADDDRLLVIGAADDADVGFASAYCDRMRREPIGAVDIIYVKPSARHAGVGEAMLGLVVSWSEQLGCVGVDAPALPGNRPAKAFFEGQGFIARLLVMHHPFGPAAPRGRR